MLFELTHDLDGGLISYRLNGELGLEWDVPYLPMAIGSISLASCGPLPASSTTSVAWDDIELIRLRP